MKKIFLFPILLITGLHAIEQPSSLIEPNPRTSLINELSDGLALTLMPSGVLCLVIAGSEVLADSLSTKKLHSSGFASTCSAVGAILIGLGYILRNKDTLLKHEAPAPLSNKDKGLMLAFLGGVTSLLSVGPALTSTRLSIEHFGLAAGILGIGVGVKMYNTDASKQQDNTRNQ